MLLRSASLSLTALLVIAASTVAWFAASREAQSDGVSIKTQIPDGYELASEGTPGRYSQGSYLMQPGLARSTGAVYSYGDKTLYATSGANTGVEWMLTPDSKFQNLAADFVDSNYPRLQPGVSGHITFYIIPPSDAVETVDCALKLELLPYQRDNSAPTGYSPLGSGAEAELLKGHILFFQSYENGFYSGWIQDGAFEVTVSGSAVEEVTVYWIWPQFFSNLHYTGGDTETICDRNAADYSALQADMLAHPEAYFSFQGSAPGDFSLEGGSYTADYHSANYNRADEKIGRRIPFVLLSLTA